MVPHGVIWRGFLISKGGEMVATMESQMQNMNRTLKQINNTLGVTQNSFATVQQACERAMNPALLESVSGHMGKLDGAIRRIAEQYEKVAEQQKKVNNGTEKGTSLVDGMLKKATKLVAQYLSLSNIKDVAGKSMTSADKSIHASAQLAQSLYNRGMGQEAYQNISAAAGNYGYYGQTAMMAGAAQLTGHLGEEGAVANIMGALSDYAAGRSSAGQVDASQMAAYAEELENILSGSYDKIADAGLQVTQAQKKVLECGTGLEKSAVLADIVGEAYGGMYDRMANTPTGQMQQFKTTIEEMLSGVGVGIYPAVLNIINLMQANLPQIQALVMGITGVLSQLINLAVSFGTFMAENWGIIGPLMLGIVGILLVYLAATKGVALAQAAGTAISAAFHAVQTFLAMGLGVLTGNTAAASAAIFTFNSSLLASPITWIIVILIALIAIIAAIVGVINKVTGSTISAVGAIMGVFAVLGAFLRNGFVVPLQNIFAALVNFVGNMFNDPIGAIKVLFLDMCLTVLGYIQKLASGIEMLLNKIPGVTVDITSGLDRFYTTLEAARDKVKDEMEWVEYVQAMDYLDYGDAWNTGYDFGAGLGARISSGLGSLEDMIGAIDGGAGLSGGEDLYGIGVSDNISSIADNTAAAAGSLSASNDQLEFLRDIAERDAINRFTTSEIRIDMTGMNNRIEGGADIDGIISQLTDGMAQALLTAAEGVHA